MALRWSSRDEPVRKPTKTHTPGPWSVDDDGFDKTTPIEVRCDGYAIADVLRSGEWHSRAVEDANARLIAAAPRLLEALAQIARECPVSDGNRDRLRFGAIAREALALVDGDV